MWRLQDITESHHVLLTLAVVSLSASSFRTRSRFLRTRLSPRNTLTIKTRTLVCLLHCALWLGATLLAQAQGPTAFT